MSKSLNAIAQALPPESSISFYVVESDSDDDTIGKMQALKQADSSFNFVSFGRLASAQQNRVRRIAECRNAYMQHLDKEISSGKSYDYVLVADLDGVNSKVKCRQPLEKNLSDSKVLCANQRGRYYDILALRKRGWVNNDFQVQSKIEEGKGGSSLFAHLQNVSKKQIKISTHSQNITVDSAFGGLAIYPTKAIAGLRYRPRLLPFGIYECEHVSVNRQVRKRGYQILIVPGLQNSGSPYHTFFANPPVLFVAGVIGSVGVLIRSLRKRGRT